MTAADRHPEGRPPVIVDPEVADAVASGRPVVALESTVFSTLGLPAPHNADAIARAHATVREGGAVPAMTAVLDGSARVGVAESDWPRILTADRKVAERDLAVAIGQRWPVGVTTVSASLRLAEHAGIAVFATGGIGGVHRDAGVSGDISADLDALAHHPLVTVCAGAKAFLDLGRTLEHLESLSVPVLGWRTDTLPAFTAADSGLPVPHRVDDAAEVAAIFGANVELSTSCRGVLLTVPPPEPIDAAVLADAMDRAESDADLAGVTGPARTPYVLGRIAEHTDGASIPANIALVANNAMVAAAIALAIAGRLRETG